MGHTLFLWSVSLLAGPAAVGQVADNSPARPGCASCQAAQQQSQAPAPPKGPLGLGIWDRLRHRNDDAEPKPGVFTRMQLRVSSWFSPAQPAELGAPIVEGSTPTPGASSLPVIKTVSSEPPINEPATIPTELKSSPTVTPAGAVVPATTGGLNTKYAEKSGHESDYSWVTGQLNFVNNQWIIEYAAPGTVDNFNGRLVLTNVDPGNLRIGDFVCASGALMTGNGGQAVAAYRVTTISLIERPR